MVLVPDEKSLADYSCDEGKIRVILINFSGTLVCQVYIKASVIYSVVYKQWISNKNGELATLNGVKGIDWK